MYHTIILLISDLNKKNEGYLLILSVLYISRKQFFSFSKVWTRVLMSCKHILKGFFTDIYESVSMQCILFISI
jgi:hypothetical protein